MFVDSPGDHAVPANDPAHDPRHSRIHQWISTVSSAHDFPGHQYSSSTSSTHSRLRDSLVRADSPLLGFENALLDPLHRPSPTYVRKLPEGTNFNARPMNRTKPLPIRVHETHVSSASHDAAEGIHLPPSFSRSSSHYSLRPPPPLTIVSPRAPMMRQPSLPVISATSVPSSPEPTQPSMPRIGARSRAHSTFSPPLTHRSHSNPLPQLHTVNSTSQHPVPPRLAQDPPPTPVTPTFNPTLDLDLQRQKLEALVIASGLADQDDPKSLSLGYHSSPSQIYLGDSGRTDIHHVVDSMTVSGESTGGSVSSPRSQRIHEAPSFSSSASVDDDEFDEDASYYGREMDQLFSPYSSSVSRSGGDDQTDTVDLPTESKWSLSSSVDMDQDKNRGSSAPKSPKNKKHRLKSFISRLSGGSNSPTSSDGQSPTTPNFSSTDQTSSQMPRQRSLAEALDSIASRVSESSSSQHGVAYGTWESVSSTPTPAMSSSNDHHQSRSRRQSIVTNERNSTDTHSAPPSPPPKKKLSVDTSFTSFSNTSITNSPVDFPGQAQLPLKHSMSSTHLRQGQLASGLKGFVSRIGLSPVESVAEDDARTAHNPTPTPSPPPPIPTPRGLKGMLSKKNGSTLSLKGLGLGKSSKPKRRLLINGVEEDNLRKYEAIQRWCEGFGEVVVTRAVNGAIVADFKKASVANTVCCLRAQVQIKGAGSVSLSWTTKQKQF